jgi:predicted 2-oxoglutarate/Fe(II)-dependent dioxygenase YbiX
MNPLSDFIVVTEPLLSKGMLEKILAATNGVKWRIPPSDGDYKRTCTTFPLSAAAAGNYPVPKDRSEHVKWADKALVSVTLQALRTYKKKHSKLFTRTDCGFDILRYEKGQFIGDHVDDREPRVLAMSIALNDDYTGGEFSFWKDTTVPLPAGCAIMFPPNFMFPHQILPVISGTRYSMITWFS